MKKLHLLLVVSLLACLDSGESEPTTSFGASTICEAASADIVVNGGATGTVAAQILEGELWIDLSVMSPWTIANARIYAGPGPVPATAAEFPVAQPVSPPATSTAVMIPVSSLAVACGADVLVQVELELVGEGIEGTQLAAVGVGGVAAPNCCVEQGGAGGEPVNEGGAPGEGGAGGEPLNEGGSVSEGGAGGEPDPEPLGCTLSQGFWKNHQEHWPVSSLTLGAERYSEAELAALLRRAPNGDGSVILAKQLIAAKLNDLHGAAADPAIADADALLVAVGGRLPLGLLSGEARTDALELALQLDAYNNGRAGPPKCGERCDDDHDGDNGDYDDEDDEEDDDCDEDGDDDEAADEDDEIL